MYSSCDVQRPVADPGGSRRAERQAFLRFAGLDVTTTRLSSKINRLCAANDLPTPAVSNYNSNEHRKGMTVVSRDCRRIIAGAQNYGIPCVKSTHMRSTAVTDELLLPGLCAAPSFCSCFDVELPSCGVTMYGYG